MRNAGRYDTLKPMQISSWQSQLQDSIKEPVVLLEQLELSAAEFSLANHSLATFPVRVPLPYLGKIRSGDPGDPLLRQVLPVSDEDLDKDGYTSDPLAELDRLAVPGVLHKYHGRVLLITTGACAIHCRYCFRRHFPYAENHSAITNWSPAMDYISTDPGITEVILSGGDPLMLADSKLNNLVGRLGEIKHLKRLRIHTRMPSVLPDRITNSLLGILTAARLDTVIVSHSNHPNEIDAGTEAAFNQIRTAGITLLNQAVLLKGINDKPSILAELFERLFTCGVLPYYLHMPDKVAGTGHYDVAQETALSIMEELRKILPGYLVPRLVREMPGAPYKIPVA